MQNIIKYKYYIIPFLLILLCVMYFIINDNKNSEKNRIKNTFEKNEDLFGIVVDELSTLSSNEDIYFYPEDGKLTTKIHYHDGDKVIIKKIDNNEYNNTINLIKNLSLIRVKKESENIIFEFNLTLNSSKNIVYVSDILKYENNYHIILKENIKDKWYYIESN